MIQWGAKNIDVITLFVEDLPEAKSFYERVFGLSSVYEDDNSAVYNFGNMSVNLLKITEADELTHPAPVANRGAGARFVFTIRVANVDTLCTELNSAGVALLNGPMDRPWGIRTASFQDPGGHIWEIAQELR